MWCINVLFSERSHEQEKRCRNTEKHGEDEMGFRVSVVADPLAMLVAGFLKILEVSEPGIEIVGFPNWGLGIWDFRFQHGIGTYSKWLLVVDRVVTPDFLCDTHYIVNIWICSECGDMWDLYSMLALTLCFFWLVVRARSLEPARAKLGIE